MKISETFYNNAGELMAPQPLDVKLASATPGGIPSVEAGFYYRFKFEGRTVDEYRSKYARFFASMRSVPGYSTLTLREYTVRIGNFVRHGVDVVYVVETAEGATSTPATRSVRFVPTPPVRPSNTAVTRR